MKKQFALLHILRRLDALVQQRIEEGLLYDKIANYPLRVELLRLREAAEEKLEERGTTWLLRFSEKLNDLVVVPE